MNIFGPTQRLVFALLLFAATASGQQVSQPADLVEEAEVEDIRRYSVELIIFEYADGSAGGTEVFLPEEPPAEELPLLEFGDAASMGPTSDQFPVEQQLPAGGNSVTTSEDGIENSAEIEPAPFSPEELILGEIPGPQQIGLQVMQPDEYSMLEIYDKLVRLDAYTPLLHTGWTQDTVIDAEIRPLRLRRLGDPPLRLDGELSLYLSRYLHLALDIALEDSVASSSPGYGATEPNTRDTGTSEYASSNRNFGDDRATSTYEFDSYGAATRLPVFYRIQEDRLVRNGELRYYDHPKFGAVARISRVEEIQLEADPFESASDVLTSDGANTPRP
jgi:hypothetical protein